MSHEPAEAVAAFGAVGDAVYDIPREGIAADAFRILLVDDNVDANESMAELLGLMGYPVASAQDGASALARLVDFGPHLILCDIGLPGMSGYELVVELRARAAGRKVVIVAATGYGHANDRTRSLAAGFDHHLVKPIDIDMLLDFISQQAVSY